jgi:sigma-B regulation protein RsbU (phosphoserine phosphatase)
MTRIHIMTGPQNGQSIELEGDTIFVGRAPDNDVQVKDRYVSRKHLKIIKKDDSYFIEDLESKNGTYVDGHPITAGREVETKEGVPIVIGMSVLCVGEGYSEDVLAFLNSMNLAGHVGAGGKDAAAGRSMTLRKNQELIQKVTDIFVDSDDVDVTLRKFLHHIFQLFKRIDRGAILLTDPETGRISEAASRIRKDLDPQVVEYNLDVVNRVIKDGKAVMVSDVQADDKKDLPDTAEIKGIKSVMCVPLIGKSKVFGVIYVDSIKKPHGFRKEDLSIFTVLSDRAATALEKVLEQFPHPASSPR